MVMWIQVLVVVAVVMYIVGNLMRFLSTLPKAYLMVASWQLNKVYAQGRQEIVDAFELWWAMQLGGDLHNAIFNKTTIVNSEIRAAITEEQKRLMTVEAVQQFKGAAMNVAINERIGPQLDEVYATLSFGAIARNRVASWREERERVLNEQRILLVGVGIDLNALHEQFAA